MRDANLATDVTSPAGGSTESHDRPIFCQLDEYLTAHPELQPSPEVVALQRAAMQQDLERRAQQHQRYRRGPKMVGLSRRLRRECRYGRVTSIERTSRESHRTRPGHRTGSSSLTSSQDPGDDGEPPGSPLIWGTACPQCAAPLHRDRAGAEHCGGCAITWWEGVR